MRLSRTGRQRSGRVQARCKHQHCDYNQYRKQNIAVPGILLSVYAFPFFPFSHCLRPYCVMQYRFLLDSRERPLASRDFTYFHWVLNVGIACVLR